MVVAAGTGVGLYVPVILILFIVFVLLVTRSRRGRAAQRTPSSGEAVSTERDVTP